MSAVAISGDEELLEEELVGETPDLRTAEPVDLVAATDQSERAGQGVLDLGEDQRGGGEDTLSLAEFDSDAFLLLAAEVFGDGTGDDASRQPSALLLQLVDPRPGVDDLGFSLALLLGQLGPEPFADRLLEVFGEPNGGVVLFHGSLHVLGWKVGLLAGGPALVAAKTEEVQVPALGL